MEGKQTGGRGDSVGERRLCGHLVQADPHRVVFDPQVCVGEDGRWVFMCLLLWVCFVLSLYSSAHCQNNSFINLHGTAMML